MAIALVGSGQASGGNTNQLTRSATDGNVLVMFASSDTGATFTPSTVSGSTSAWTTIADIDSGYFAAIAYAYATATGSVTIECSTGGGFNQGFVLAEFSGLLSSGILDGSERTNTFAAATSTNLSTTTTNENDLLLACYRASGTPTTFAWNGSYSSVQAVSGMQTGYRIVSATGTYDPAPTWANSLSGVIVGHALKAESVAPLTIGITPSNTATLNKFVRVV